MNNIQHAADQVRKFNTIAGVLNPSYADEIIGNIELYLSLIKEELQETVDAFDAEDIQEVVDGACDLFVVVNGLMQVLESGGVNIDKALTRVCDNNLSKFPPTFQHNSDPELQPEGTECVETPYGHVVYKRLSDGKVMKPTTFVPVNLAGTFPITFFGSVAQEESK